MVDTIVDITQKIINAYQVLQLDMIQYVILSKELIQKLKSVIMQIFRLKIGTLFPLQSMEMEYQFSNEKSALQILTLEFELAIATWVLSMGTL